MLIQHAALEDFSSHIDQIWVWSKSLVWLSCLQEQHFLIEDLYKTVEKMEETQEMNMTNKVNIEFLREQLDKALADIEGLKDKVRENGKSY